MGSLENRGDGRRRSELEVTYLPKPEWDCQPCGPTLPRPGQREGGSVRLRRSCPGFPFSPTETEKKVSQEICSPYTHPAWPQELPRGGDWGPDSGWRSPRAGLPRGDSLAAAPSVGGFGHGPQVCGLALGVGDGVKIGVGVSKTCVHLCTPLSNVKFC